MSRHFWHSIVSVLIVMGLIVPTTLGAQAPASKAAPISEPTSPSSQIDAASATASAVRSSGRLFFAPAIDADGDPATNPIESAPVPVIRIGAEAVGMVQLAAQVTLDDKTRAPSRVPVTFRVWDASGTVFQKTVRTDAWGAAEVDVSRLKVEGVYSYQVSAPGFDATEVRGFRFDAQQASYTLHWRGAQLAVDQSAVDHLVVTLHSPVPLDADQDRAAVLIVRQTAEVGALRPGLLSPTDRTQTYLPLPAVHLKIVGTYTAALDLQLPPGDYRFMASLVVARERADQFYSQPVTLTVKAGPSGAENPSAAWVSPVEFEPGRVLVRYHTASDRAVFDLVPTQSAPAVEPQLPEQAVWTKQYRTGPFDWQTEQQVVHIDTRVDDGKKQVVVQELDYDPLARRYQIAIKPKGDETITDTLRVAVLGPGGVVLQQEVISVTLTPKQVTYHTVEVPADKGQPAGLSVSLDDPLEKIYDGLKWAIGHLVRLIKKYGTASGHLTLSADAIGFTLLQYQIFVPENDQGEFTSFEWLPDGPSTWAEFFVTVTDYVNEVFGNITERFEVDLGGVNATVGVDVGVKFTLNLGSCATSEEKAIAANELANLARQAQSKFDDTVGKKLEKLQSADSTPLISVPINWFLFFGLVFNRPTVGGSISAEDLTLSITANLSVGAGGRVFGDLWPFDVDLAKVEKIAEKIEGWYNTLQAVRAFYNIVYDIWQRVNFKNDVLRGQCGDPPDQHPADDRQDVWQGAENFYQASTFAQTIDNLNVLLERSRRLGLTRAERYVQLQLSSVQLDQFEADNTSLVNHLDDWAHIMANSYADQLALISGTLPISPSQTITEAVFARGELAMAQIDALPYSVQHQQAFDAVALAQQHYLELRGQELDLQQELRALFMGDAIGVLASGFSDASLAALREAGLPGQLISPWPDSQTYKGLPAPYVAPDLAPRTLIVPTSGLRELNQSAEAQAWLDQYVQGGGLLIVFTQAFGADWQLLPGGQVRGVGYEEDQRCEQESVRAGMPSNWLVWMGDATPDIQVDGAFTAWPSNANMLLLRRSGTYAGYPAMIEYPYGAGRVLATSAYGDWSTQTGIWWGDDWQMTRSILIRAYLLMHGQDIDSVQVAAPNTNVNVSFPLTNTASFTATAARVELPLFSGVKSSANGVTANFDAAPQAGQIVTATLHTPEVLRHVHNWTQVGLFHVRAKVQTAANSTYTVWGPFLRVTTPITSPNVSLTLIPQQPSGRLFQSVAVTATVHNWTGVTQSVVLSGLRDWPATPITLTLPPGAEVTHPQTLLLDRSQQPQVKISDLGGAELDRAGLTLYIAGANLAITPRVVPPLAANRVITLELDNRSDLWQPAAPIVGGTLNVTLTSPAGATLQTFAQPFSLQINEHRALPFTLSDLGATMPGQYRLKYSAHDGDAVLTQGEALYPAQWSVTGQFHQAEYFGGQTVVFTATLHNTAYFDLAPTITVTVPGTNVTVTQLINLPVGGAVNIPMSYLLPAGAEQGGRSVQVTAAQSGVTSTATFNLNVIPANVQAVLAAGPYLAGQPLTLTLSNTGGVDAAADYTVRVIDRLGRPMVTMSDMVTIAVGQRLDRAVALPANLVSGPYIVTVSGREQFSQRTFSLERDIVLPGIGGQIAARTTQPAYSPGDSIVVTGAVTVTQGVYSGTAELAISRAQAGNWLPGPVERVNPADAPVYGGRDHQPAAVVMDAAGDAYAVWADGRHSISDGRHIYFAYKPAGGAWSQNERVSSIFTTTAATAVDQQWPDLAVDAAGNAYVVWKEYNYKNSNWQYDIFFAMRSVTGTWTTPIEVNTDLAQGAQNAPVIAADPAGNVIVLWEDWRSGTTYHVFYRTRSSTGTWSADQQLSATDWATMPDVAMDASGAAYAVWTDYRTVASRPDIYFAHKPLTGTWSAVQVVNDVTTTAQLDPAIAVDAAGNAVVAWTDYRNGATADIYFATRPYSATTWSASQKVNDDATPNNQAAATIAIDAANNAYVAWEDYRNATTNPDVYYATRSNLGAWSANERLHSDPITTTQWQYSPTIAVDAAGQVLALWSNGASAPTSFYYADLASATRPLTDTWQASGLVNDDLAASNQYFPDLKLDAAGNAYATWSGDGPTGNGVYLSARPFGGDWPAPTRVDVAGSSGATLAALDLDPAGNAAVVWADARNQATWGQDIYFARRAAAGTWSANERVNDDVGNTVQTRPDVAVDAAGNTYAIWQDARNGGSIYFASRPVTGTWSANTLVTSAAAAHSFPAIAVDAIGNAYAVWMDKRENFGSFSTIYFAYRPVTGTWGTNIKISGVTTSINNVYPDIAVDGQGRAYAIWSRGNQDIYFASRSVTGTWSAPGLVISGTPTLRHDQPAITVDADGKVYATWQTSLNGGLVNNAGLSFAYRPVGGPWTAPVLLREAAIAPYAISWPTINVNTHGDIGLAWYEYDLLTSTADTSDIQFMPLLETGGAALWSKTVDVPLGTMTQLLNETPGTLGAQPGKYWLSANFRSALSQTIASSRYPFYLYPPGAAVTLDVSQLAARPGETITITGRMTNTAGVAANLALTLTANSQILFTQTLALNPNEGASYSVSQVVSQNTTYTAVAGAATATEQVNVAAPQGTASLSAPVFADYAPFSVTLMLTNTGSTSATLIVMLANTTPQTTTINAGEVQVIAQTTSITQATALTATVRGDWTLDLNRPIGWGLAADLNLSAPFTPTSGLNSIDYGLTNTGNLPVMIVLHYGLDGDTSYSQKLLLAPSQTINSNLVIDVPTGIHTLSVDARDVQNKVLKSKTLSLGVREVAATLQPDLKVLNVQVSPSITVAAGSTISVVVSTLNRGVSGPVIVGVIGLTTPQQRIITSTAFTTQTITLSTTIPADLPAGTYAAQVIIAGQVTPFTVNVSGVKIDLAFALDKPAYRSGEVVSTFVTLTEQAGISGSYQLSLRYLDAERFITVSVPAHQTVQHTLIFTATESDRVSVMLANVPSANEQGQRTIMIDSLPVSVIDDQHSAYLTFDQSIYQAGETINFAALISGTVNDVSVQGPLEVYPYAASMWWSAPNITTGLGLAITGTYPLTYALPAQLPSGRYTFRLGVDGNPQLYPIDVQGWSVSSYRVLLDKTRYARTDTINAEVAFLNEGTALNGLRLSAWIMLPDDAGLIPLAPPVSRTIDLQPGLNTFTVTGDFTTTLIGPHRVLINLYQPGSAMRVAGAVAQFEVGSAHLIDLTTDRGDYVVGEAGTGRVDVYGLGTTQIVVTSSVGSTVFSTTTDLSGFQSFTFTIPTAVIGDYALIANSVDAAGNIDQRLRAYAVPAPLDTTPPTITLTSPAPRTIVTSAALSVTLPITGHASDNSGTVRVLVNGRVVTPTINGDFSANVVLNQGYNSLSIAAIDPTGNVTVGPFTPIYLLPARGARLSADRATAQVGDVLKYQIVLTTTGAYSNVQLILPLPTTLITNVVVTANHGQTSIMPAALTAQAVWQGDVTTQAVTITVQGTLLATGTLSTTATTYWGLGFSEAHSNSVAISASNTRKVYLPLLRR